MHARLRRICDQDEDFTLTLYDDPFYERIQRERRHAKWQEFQERLRAFRKWRQAERQAALVAERQTLLLSALAEARWKQKLLETTMAIWDKLSREAPTKPQAAAPDLPVAPVLTTGEKIERLMQECGWSFDDLANKANLSKSLTIGHVKHGKGCNPSTLKKYSKAFSDYLQRPISPSDLKNSHR